MKLYVWRCPETLRNYASGIAVVAAESVEAAFAKLRVEAPAAWIKLMYGNHQGYVETEAEIAWELDQEDFETEEGFPLQPEEFELDALPVLYRMGGS